jgi:hypothetical protein
MFYHFLSIEAFHLFTVAAEERTIQAGIEIIFLNADGRFFCVNEIEMKEGTDHLTEMAATALLGIDFNSHLFYFVILSLVQNL